MLHALVLSCFSIFSAALAAPNDVAQNFAITSNTDGSQLGSWALGSVHPNTEARTVGSAKGDSPDQSTANHIQRKIRKGDTPSRGVNLGGWLVSEQWMTSSAPMFVDLPPGVSNGGEFQVLKNGGNTAKRLQAFTNHHDTFVTERDIRDIARAGLNTVRVPVGYWIMGSDPSESGSNPDWKVFPNGTVVYLDKLIKNWALKHNIAVMISIHGAKGSQNGADHSAPTTPGKAYWSDFEENVNNTIYLARYLADRYKNDAAFLGMGLLNEPNGETNENVVNQYYKDAYKAVRATGTDCILSIMPMLSKQDATNLNGFMEAPEYTNVWVEWHPYFIWGYDSVSASDLLTKSIATDFQNKVNTWNSRPNANKLFFGEWCLANTGQFPNPDTDAFQSWAKAQIKVMDQAKGGWTYWSWRVYDDDHDGAFNAWSMRNVLAKPVLSKILLGSDASQS